MERNKKGSRVWSTKQSSYYYDIRSCQKLEIFIYHGIGEMITLEEEEE